MKVNIEKECKAAILGGNILLAKELAETAITQNLDIYEFIDAFLKSIREAGDLFEEGEFFLPELMRSAEAMKAGMTIFMPIISKDKEDRALGRVVIGTIEGDIHDIGKTLVASLLSAEGFEVYDLGADVPISTFIDKAVEVDAHLICISALLTTTMVGQKRLIDKLIEKNLRDRFKILIGGAPVSKHWVEEIGADGTAENAVSAVKLARKLVNR
ncbi:MAG: corrinoid protein [Candidatus Heimdallarchaeota archaeon]|nr:corrinoid protein [Candidatus Heimdallarchaeota archaeon]MCK4954456.1 corrinoid protein [Candidatus Heimdallarchaeota archaeon]